MAPPKQKTISSPLVSALNNIVSINRSGSTMKSTQQSYQGFLKFMDVEIRNIESIKLPKKRELQKLSNLNVAATFGSAGSLLSSLATGALDAAGFVGDFFSGKKRGGAKPNPKAGGPIPKGKGISLGGVRALGIANAAFAGLDFATGLAEGESVGKAAAGAGGALAGSLLGGAIGSVLIPAPPIGFILGSMAGNFLGGYLGDRAHEAATGTGEQDLKRKQKEKLKAQEQKQKAAAMSSGLTMSSVLDKFDSVVTKFEQADPGSSSGSGTQDIGGGENPFNEPVEYPPIEETPEGGGYDGPVSGDTFFPLPGGKSGESAGQLFGASRDGGKRKHAGLDMTHHTGPLNAAVAAHKTGKVTAAVHNGYNGFVTIDHGGGLKTRYYHTTPSVKVGDTVYGGQKIANLYPDGQNTHLHFEIYKGGSPINPSSAGLGQKLPTPLTAAKAKEQSEKTSGKSSVAPDANPQSAPPPQTQTDTQQTSTSNPPGALAPGQRPDAALTSQQFKIATETREQGKQSGMQGEELEKYVAAAVMNAANTASELQSQVQPTPSQIAQSLMFEQYPTYNQQQSSTTIVPILMSAGGGQQRPQVISVGGGGGGGGQTIMLPGPSGGQVLNSLLKTMLLTNLSGT
jgi:murein DD-endopeptidase MepM/ murein hydrolase activator NlpD